MRPQRSVVFSSQATLFPIAPPTFIDDDDLSVISEVSDAKLVDEPIVNTTTSVKQPGAKRRKLDYSDTITVLVGAEEKPYIVHNAALTARSAFFRAAVEGDFRESIEKVIRLPEVDVESWCTYIHWIYSKELLPLDEDQIENDKSGAERRDRLIKVYVLADVVDDMALRNEVVDQYIKIVNDTKEWTSNSIALLFDSTPKNSKLRTLLIDYTLHSPKDTAEFLESNYDLLPKSFHFEVASKSLKNGADKGKNTSLPKYSACTYHEHDEKLPLCA